MRRHGATFAGTAPYNRPPKITPHGRTNDWADFRKTPVRDCPYHDVPHYSTTFISIENKASQCEQKSISELQNQSDEMSSQDAV